MPSAAPINVLAGLPDSASFSPAFQTGTAEGAFISLAADGVSVGDIPFSFNDLRRFNITGRRGLWWFEPFIGNDSAIMDDWIEGCFALIERTDGTYAALVPLVGENYRAVIRGEGNFRLRILIDEWTAAPDNAPYFLVATGSDPYELVEESMAAIAARFKTFALLKDKHQPEMLDYLGWCTWDAFYKEVTEEKVLDGLESFREGGFVPRFMILDDGWYQQRDHMMMAMEPDPVKFPNGFKPLVDKAKSEYGLELVCLWHAFQGYWTGLHPESPLAERYIPQVNTRKHDRFKGWPAQYDPDVRCMISARDICEFYSEWHAYIRSEGFDGVKVDNQGSMDVFTSGIAPQVRTMRAYQRALQGAGQTHFRGNVIHCMCNTNDALFNLSASVVWRNSDDFYPKKGARGQAEHIVRNAFNNVWTSTVAVPDWDMFQSGHEFAGYHAAGRAISGGTIYVSDKPRTQDFELIRSLCTEAGRAIRYPKAARPLARSLFADPREEDCLLKIANQKGEVGQLAVFHARVPEEGEGKALAFEPHRISDRYRAAEVLPGTAERAAIWSRQGGFVGEVDVNEVLEIALEPMGWDLLSVAPVREGVAVFGLINKLAGPATVRAIRRDVPDHVIVELVEGGTLGIFCERMCTATANGVELVIDSRGNGMYHVDIPLEATSIVIATT